MSLPADRRIGHGRTYSASWNALDYACPLKGYRQPLPVSAIYRVLGWLVVALLSVPMALHFALPLIR